METEGEDRAATIVLTGREADFSTPLRTMESSGTSIEIKLRREDDTAEEMLETYSAQTAR
jgi:hypothetical protein